MKLKHFHLPTILTSSFVRNLMTCILFCEPFLPANTLSTLLHTDNTEPDTTLYVRLLNPTSQSCPRDTFRQFPRQYAWEQVFTEASYCWTQDDSASEDSTWKLEKIGHWDYSVETNLDCGMNTILFILIKGVTIKVQNLNCAQFRLWFDRSMSVIGR